MKHILILSNFFFFLSIFCFGQKMKPCQLKCYSFQEGKYAVSYDSFLNDTLILRTANKQIETDSDGNEATLSINWIDDCSFYMTYLSSDKELPKNLDVLKKPNAVKVQFISVKNDTLKFKTIIPYGDRVFETEGEMIKKS